MLVGTEAQETTKNTITPEKEENIVDHPIEDISLHQNKVSLLYRH